MKSTATTSNFKLFQQIGRSIRRSMEPDEMLQNAVDAIGWHFGLDRCVALLLDDVRHEVRIAAQFSKEPMKPVSDKKIYALRTNSEWHRLLSEGRPVPLMDIQPDNSSPAGPPELDRFRADTGSKSLIAFPLLNQGRLLGALTMHFCSEGRSLSEEMLELGEALAEELSGALRQASSFQEKLVDGRVFANSNLPLLVVEPESLRIVHHNESAAELLSGKGVLADSPLKELFSQTDGNRLKEAIRELTPWTAVVDGGEFILPRVDGQPLVVQILISSVAGSGGAARQVLITVIPKKGKARGPESLHTTSVEDGGKSEDLVSSLSRQLNWERVTRQITNKLHSSLDRDTILQAAADSVGRAMKATACLIIRTDGPGSAMVTHEYADPNLSPLGLGRTGYLPPGAISAFKQRTTSINDLTAATKPQGLSRDEVNALIDNGIRALIGTPVTLHGIPYGVIIVESDEPREWNPQELEMLETVATSAALALTNAHTYAQVKDNLFNMNLISNLTQQLTNALDQATRTGKPEKTMDSLPSESSSTPLSVRELEVLKLIASGLANREIAQRLFLTESTVELHASRIRKKLKLKSRTALVKYACDNHLV